VAYRLNIIVVTGLVINLIAGLANAANQNPWAMDGGKRDGNTGGVNSSGFAAVPSQQQPFQQRVAPKNSGYEYAPLGKNQDPANSRNRQSNGQFQRQPYRQGYGFQPFGQGGFGGNFGGQFGFGMNFAPNFSQGFSQGFGGTGMPFGFGVPAMPFFGGSNNYGTPYRGVPGYQNANPYGNLYGNPYANPYGYPRTGFSPWGMGFPMF